MNNYLDVLKKYTVFDGRARRSEYWMFFLVNLIVIILLSIIDSAVLGAKEYGILASLYSLGTLLPNIAVTIRRLHDTNKSGWWILIGLIPILGAIILIVFLATDSNPIANQYGPNPKAGNDSSVVPPPPSAPTPPSAPIPPTPTV